MKTIFALSLLTFAAMANAGTPWVRNNGTSVTLDYWNSSDYDQRCSGSIYLDMEDGSRNNIRVYEFVWKRGSIYRTYRPNTSGVRIRNVSHSVWCW